VPRRSRHFRRSSKWCFFHKKEIFDTKDGAEIRIKVKEQFDQVEPGELRQYFCFRANGHEIGHPIKHPKPSYRRPVTAKVVVEPEVDNHEDAA